MGSDLTEICSISLEMQSRWEQQESTDKGPNAIGAKNNSGVAVPPLICLCIFHIRSLDTSSSFFFLLVFLQLPKSYILQCSSLHERDTVNRFF